MCSSDLDEPQDESEIEELESIINDPSSSDSDKLTAVELLEELKK